MKAPLWIEIANWDEFQHYKDRSPPWIKLYTSLLHDPVFLKLTGHERAVLMGLWMMYASSRRQIPVDTTWITRQLNLKTSRATLVSLSDAGFIHIRASKPLAPRYPEKEEEKKRLKAGVNKTGENQERFTLEDVLKDMPRG